MCLRFLFPSSPELVLDLQEYGFSINGPHYQPITSSQSSENDILMDGEPFHELFDLQRCYRLADYKLDTPISLLLKHSYTTNRLPLLKNMLKAGALIIKNADLFYSRLAYHLKMICKLLIY